MFNFNKKKKELHDFKNELNKETVVFTVYIRSKKPIENLEHAVEISMILNASSSFYMHWWHVKSMTKNLIYIWDYNYKELPEYLKEYFTSVQEEFIRVNHK